MKNINKNNIVMDFRWIFTADTENCEDDKKFKEFLKKMYISGRNTFLLLRKDETEYLKNFTFQNRG